MATSVAPLQQEKRTTAGDVLSSTPDSILKSVLSQYPGLASVYNPNNVQVVIADPTRRAAAQKYNAGSQLEFWPSSEAGSKDFPRPANMEGKSILEIYSPQLAANPDQLRGAIYGDLLHGMSSNPYWTGLRSQFMQNFTPQELKRQQGKQTWWDDVNNSKGVPFGPTYDAYIRGYLTPGDEQTSALQGQKESGNTMYSPKQMEILKAMQDFLRTGKTR